MKNEPIPHPVDQLLMSSGAMTPDQEAAHQFLSELRTRIATQPLPYQHGVEARALESLWEVFGHARDAMKKNPGCVQFAEAVTQMLNVDLRPITAKWHRAHAEGRLNSRDGADDFRGDLAEAQKKLQAFAKKMHEMAYAKPYRDALTGPAVTEDELDKCFKEVAFGIEPCPQIDQQTRAQINSQEADEVKRRREHHRVNTGQGKDAVGVGFSGGGIRSATFCLGVAQVLAERGLLKEVDFLSTVSGGGYTGSFLTTRLGTGEPSTDVAAPGGPDPAAIRYLRHHAKFLAAANLKAKWAMVTATLAGMLLNWTVPVLLMVICALIARGVFAAFPSERWLPVVGVLGLLTGVALVVYGWMMREGRGPARIAGRWLGVLLAVTLLFGAIWLIIVGYDSLPKWIAEHWRFSGVVGAVIAAGPSILRFLPVLRSPMARKIVLRVLLLAAAVVLPLLLLALFYVFYSVAQKPANAELSVWNPLHYMNGVGVLICGAGVLALVALSLNINLTAPHRLYRDGLANTFVLRNENDDAPSLEQVNPRHSAPYHLINATVNLPSSQDHALRDRQADFFLFSKHWCGSPLVQYRPTSEWRMNGERADIATAMAVSGAAVSPHMGLGSIRPVRSLLTFLNVRLGFWIRHPLKKGRNKSPGFICLLREMAGVGMSEHKKWLNLSDGGHIENMAVYELLRRRCKFIICVDGEADPSYTFSGLMTLVRHAQIDFGISIKPKLEPLRPDAKTGYSQAHALLCRVHYPAHDGVPAATGLLLYMKLSVTGNESELIKRYRLIHPEFPHESTLDQFFDEEQFEAYRQLGVHVADGLFSKALMNGQGAPANIPQWFRRLAGNLLEPEIS